MYRAATFAAEKIAEHAELQLGTPHTVCASKCAGRSQAFRTDAASGITYCTDCWAHWADLKVARHKASCLEDWPIMCESCKVEAAECSGSKQFAGLSYCARCWAAWFESAAQRRAAAGVAGPQSIGCYPWYAPKTSANSPLQGQHLQFIEIGTSTWGTLSQYCAGDYKAASSLGARFALWPGSSLGPGLGSGGCPRAPRGITIIAICHQGRCSNR